MTEPLIKTPTAHTSMNGASTTDAPLLLDIENLSVTFGQGKRAFRAVDDVSLKITQVVLLYFRCNRHEPLFSETNQNKNKNMKYEILSLRKTLLFLKVKTSTV